MKRTAARAAAIAIVLAAATRAGDADACSCMKRTAHAMVESAEVAFEGRVTSIDDDEGMRGAHFDVSRAWKGGAQPSAVVWTPSDGARCGYAFRTGGVYVVLASHGEQGKLVTTSCSGTGPSDFADAMLAELGAPAATFGDAAASPSPAASKSASPAPAKSGGCGGCSCSTSASAPGDSPAWLALLVLLLVMRRRSREAAVAQKPVHVTGAGVASVGSSVPIAAWYSE
jgi:MYXO-CTERM domain-containing protein